MLEGEELQHYFQSLNEGWELVDNHHLEKTFRFENFKEALDFTYEIGQMSEREGHHPNIGLSWGKVKVRIYTHAIDGLSENDFIWASKADQLYF
jgi:4a-hydroxytetrahydrobiopterin dehydratase